MRVIAGTAKGIRLEAPRGLDIRPTLDRVREALFSILQPRIEGAAFLDLFAGAGANGIEALSRGAARAVFVDADPRALAAIRANLQRARLDARAMVMAQRLPAGLARIPHAATPFDLAFADPPYAFGAYAGLLEALSGGLLTPEALVVVEHDARRPCVDQAGSFQRTRTATYGAAALSFYEAARPQEA